MSNYAFGTLIVGVWFGLWVLVLVYGLAVWLLTSP